MINFFIWSSDESSPDHRSIQEFLFGWISSGTPRAVERFSDKRDPAGFLSYFLKLQKFFRSPAMSLARWLNVTWNSFKPQVPSGLYKTCSADGHTRVSICPRLVVVCVHCRVRTEHYSQIGRWSCRAAACVIPLLYLTSAYTPRHGTLSRTTEFRNHRL